MKTKHLALLALGMILMVIGGQVPYLAVDFRLRETIWSLRSLVEILPWLEGSLFAIVGLAVILRVFRQNQPPGIRFRNALILSLLAYAFFPLSMNGAVLTLSMLVSVSGFAVAAQGLGSRNRLAAHPRTLGSAGSGSLLLRPGRSAWISSLLIAGLGLNLVVAGIVFDFRPCIIDTLDQVFQARVFLTGQLTAPAPPVPRAFEFLYMIIRDGHWYSQYPPGHPLMLALGLVIGGSWMIGPLLGALLPVLLYATGRAIWNERTGRMAGLIGLAAPYLHLMAGSHMSHSTCAFFLLLGAFGLVRLLRGGGLGSALITATGFGYALWTRPYPALAVSLAAALGCLLTLGSVRRIRWPYAFLALVGATLPVCLLLLYNWKTNGHPLVFGYNITQGPLHRLGFGLRRMNETVRVFTLWEALKQTGYHLNGLNVFALGTALPATWLVVLPFLARRRHPFLGLVSLLAAAPVIAFFFYPFTDFVLGPRLVFTALPFGVLLAARGLVCLPRTGPRMRALAARPAVVFLLFLPVIPNLIGAMDFNRRLFRRSHDRIASFLSTHPVDRALVLCDDAIFSQYGFGQLRPGLPPDRPVFARDVHSADLVGHFADRPAFRFAYDSAGCLALEKHVEPVVDLYDLIANGHPSVRAVQGMQTATHVLTLDSLQGETHKLLYGFRTPASVTVALQIPPDAFLRFSAIVHPDAWARGSNGVTFRLTLLPDGASERSEPIEIYHQHLGRDCSPMALLDQEVDLRPWSGKTVQLQVQAQPGPDDPHRGDADVFDISNLRIIRRVRP